jgi:hypothetical protein
VSTPSWTKIAGHKSRTSITKAARLRRASSQPDKMEKKVGEETTTTSARPLARAPSRTLLAMKLRWPSDLRTIPSFAVA